MRKQSSDSLMLIVFIAHVQCACCSFHVLPLPAPCAFIGFSLERSNALLWGQENQAATSLTCRWQFFAFFFSFFVWSLLSFPFVTFLCCSCQLQWSNSWREVQYSELKNLSLLFKTGLALRGKNLIALMNGCMAGLQWDYKAVAWTAVPPAKLCLCQESSLCSEDFCRLQW